MGEKHEEIHCQLSDEDGNAIAIIARVAKALKKAHYPLELIADYEATALIGSYDDLIQLSMSTLDKAGVSHS